MATEPETTRRPKGSKPRRGCVGCLAVAGLLLVCALVGLVLARHAIATMMLEDALDRGGVVCAPTPEVTIDLDLSHATLAPTRCVLPDGAPILAVSFDGPLALTLEDGRLAEARADRVTVELRHPPPALPDRGTFVGPLAVLAGARGVILALMKAGAESASHDVIVAGASIEELAIAYGGTNMATLRDVRSTSVPGALSLHASSIALAGIDLGVTAVDVAVTPTEGETTADLAVEALGFRRTVRATLTAGALDTASPTIEASLGAPP